MTNSNSFLLSISCWTYNQSAYITDAMNGFAMQQTNFPFVAVIIDDASTDDEQDVIKSYIEEHFDHSEKTGYREWETDDACLIFARHKVNENCHFVVALLKRNLFKEPEKKGAVVKEWTDTKYVALCEGDDYWTNPLKLQRQVDFMENNPEIGLCYTNFNMYEENADALSHAVFHNGMHRSQNFEDHLLSRGFIAPLTWLYNNNVYKNIHPENLHSDGTFSIALEFFHHSKVAYLDEVTATYRVHSNSASRQSNPEKNWKYVLGVMKTQLEYARKYGDEKLVEKVYMNNYLMDTFFLAVDLDKTDFIKEAEEYLSGKGVVFGRYYDSIKAFIEQSKQYQQIYSSRAYRMGKVLLKPFSMARNIMVK